MTPRVTLGVLLLLAPASLLLSLLSGSIDINPWALLTHSAEPLAQTVVFELRLPRALAAFAVGGMLALAGALMQVLLRNPLADPYILGISGGAAVAALLSLMAGLGGLLLAGNAFLGALASMLLVFGLAHGRGAWTATRLILTGVIVAAGWGALIGLILALAPERGLHGMLFWLMGDLSHTPPPLWGLLACGIGLLLCLPLARDLNVLARGELAASALGVAVPRLRSIGFVGLVIPHLLRLLGLHDHRHLLPGCVLAGGSLLMLADTLARTIVAPQQLPVGVITALLGVPLFLYLLNRRGTRL